MSRPVEEFFIDDDDLNTDSFRLGPYDEEEELFTQLQRRKNKLRTSADKMLRFRCCAALAALFRQPSTATRSLVWIICRNLSLILFYYALSIGLTFYQNHLLKKIHYPLMIVLCHLIVKFLMATVIRISSEICTGKRRVLLKCDDWLKRLSLIGISGGLDIGFSNWGQEFITVSLYTMSKSTAIIFILGFALLFKLEEKHWSLIVIVGMISGGLMMFTYKSTQFNFFGFCLIMTASFLSGLRWSVCQLIVQKSTLGLNDPIDMVFHVQPWMIMSILPFALFFEGHLITTLDLSLETEQHKIELFKVVYAVLLGAFMAFFMEVAEYLVVTYTSSLTLSVAGIFKEICTLCLAVIVNNDQLSFINFIGLVLCFVGIIWHLGFKFVRSARAHIEENVTTVSTMVNKASANRSAAGTSDISADAVRITNEQEESKAPLLGIEGERREVGSDEEGEMWDG